MPTSPNGRRPRAPQPKSGVPDVQGRLIVCSAHLVGRSSQALVASTVLVGLVAALPWALWHYIGWPLPEHLPTGAQVQTVLLGPLTTPLLLDVLACLCWITWAAFVIDVARCFLAAVRGLRWPQVDTGGPVHALAAILVGLIAVALLGNRSPTTATAGITEVTSGHRDIVATATVTSAPVVHARAITLVHTIGPAAAVDQDDFSVVVRAPENGIHDSLSRIAARTLGTAGRWPEIFTLNKGKPQPVGGRLTNPNLIFPGERLTLPLATLPPVPGTDHHAAPPTIPAPPSPRPAPPVLTSAPPTLAFPTAPMTTPAPSDLPAPQADSTPGFGIEWGSGVFVGLGLATAISAALVAARRRHRRRYRPGSGRRDDLPVAPVVYQLRLAHLRANHDDPCPNPDPDPDQHDQGQVLLRAIGDDPHASPRQAARRGVTPRLGIRDGREVALDLAVCRGLGLVGAGALTAARALLLALLTQPPASATTARVIIPVDDLTLLLGAQHAHSQWPAPVRVVADLNAALDELETEMLRRVRETDSGAEAAWPVLALVARPPEHNTQRLQAVLDNAAPFGLVGVLLGQWRPGLSAYIRDDGTVSSASPGPGQALLGTRMFHLPETETTEVLTLLRQAQPEAPELPAPDPEARLTPEAREGENSPPLSTEPPVANPPSTTLDTFQGASEVIDTALEVTAIPRAEPEGISSSEPRPVRADGNDHQSQHEPHSSVTGACCPVVSDPSRHHDALATPITLTVLGCPRVHWIPESTSAPGDAGATADAEAYDITAAFPPRQRELLVFLALHPAGVPRETLLATLWQDNAPQRPTNALNTALSRLRRAVGQATDGAISDLITIGESRYHLDPRVVTVDYWRLADAVATRRAAGSEAERISAYQRIVAGYHGCLAEGLDTEWIEAPRESIRRDALDAVAALARALIDADPQKTLDLLETARAFDPHNELLYRDILRLQQRLGHLDAIPRTIALLTTRLAEIDETPTAQTLELATRLQQRHNIESAAPRTPGRARRDTAAVH
ncbi:MAG: BTAD domain-containing putative transcriptional regulator [Pseudonocardiaceae bacterium]